MKHFTKLLTVIASLMLAFMFVNELDLNNLIANIGSSSEKIEVEQRKKITTKISYKSHLDKGDLRFQNGYYTLAIGEYAQASQIEPLMIDPYLKIALVHIAQKNYDKAIENFRIASQIEPANMTPKLRIGEMYIYLSEFEKAENVFNTLEGENSELYYFRAIMNILYEKYKDARFNLEKADETSDENLKGKIVTLNNAFTKFDASEGANPTYLRTLLAQTLGELNYSLLSKEVIHKVLEQNPTYRDAWIILGYANLKTENYFDAISSFNEAEKIDPYQPQTLYFLGQALIGQGDSLQGLEKLEKAYTYGFEPAKNVVLEIATTYLKLGNYKKAAEYFEKTTKIDPEYFDAYVKTIWLNLDYLNDPVNARKLALEALKNHPDSALSYNLVGWTEIANKNMTEAKIHLDKALEIDKNLAAAYLNMGILLETEGDLENAKVNYKRAFELEKATGVGQKAQDKYNTIVKNEVKLVK